MAHRPGGTKGAGERVCHTNPRPLARANHTRPRLLLSCLISVIYTLILCDPIYLAGEVSLLIVSLFVSTGGAIDCYSPGVSA
jgi:hypothetical protein